MLSMKLKKLSTLFLTVILVTVASAQENNVFCWKVKSATATIYLCGSIHVAKPDFYPLPKSVDDAFKQSDVIAVEADVLSPEAQQWQVKMMQQAILPDQKILKDVVKPETVKLLDSTAAKYNIPVLGLYRFKPIMVAFSLTMMHFVHLGYMPQLGMEYRFLQSIKSGKVKKEIVEVEGNAAQVKLLMNLPHEEAFLIETLKEMPKAEELVKQIFKAWKAGDTTLMEKVMLDGNKKTAELKAIHKALFTDRNLLMAQKVKAMLKEKKTVFFLVGSGHMIGKDGILALLKKDGIKVEQLKSK